MEFTSDMKFSVKSFRFRCGQELIIRKLIVITDENKNIVKWTDFHKYVISQKSIKHIADNSNSACFYVVQFLNFIFGEKGVTLLTDITFALVKEFLNCFSLGMLSADKQGRNKQTVETCRRIIVSFCEQLYKEKKAKCRFNPSEFYDYSVEIDSRGRTKKVKKLDIQISNNYKVQDKLKDLPTKVFFIFLNHVMKNHIDILMPVALSAFAGLRPSECFNVRREDSLLGPGLIIDRFEEKINSIKIDLTRELVLRSDLKSVGEIKVERMQQMDPNFIDVFVCCYRLYLDYISTMKYEYEFGPLIINKKGKAMLYSNYLIKFKNAMNEIKPILINSGDESLVAYAELMSRYTITPHILRHWFSVQIAVNYNNISILMSARGDKDPESAQTYLQNKSELARTYKKVNDYYAEFLKIQGERLFE